jgi:4-hydroxy-tetrahydrodipicolinate reductase
MIRVAITGAAGRMGKTLVQAITEADDLVLGAAFEHPENETLGADAGELAGVGSLGVIVTGDPAAQLEAFDVVVDFTVPAAS